MRMFWIHWITESMGNSVLLTSFKFVKPLEPLTVPVWLTFYFPRTALVGVQGNWQEKSALRFERTSYRTQMWERLGGKWLLNWLV